MNLESTVTIADLVEREIAAGMEFGPYHRHWLLERAPEKVRRNLELARQRRQFYAGRQGFSTMDINDVNTGAFTARNTSASELNIIGDTANGAAPQAMINQYCAIAANDAKAGKSYRVTFGGTYGNTGTPTLIWTPRWGSSTTVGTNVTLGASATVTTITGVSALPWFGQFDFDIRTAPPGATAGTGKGFGCVWMGIPVTNSQTLQTWYIGGTLATIDTTGQGTAGCGLTMNITWSASSASNTLTCEHFLIQSNN